MTEKTGTYISISYDSTVTNLIHKIYSKCKIPDLLSPDKLHTTLVYCDNKKETVSGIESTLAGKYIQIINPRYELIGPDECCLVIRFDSPVLASRHTELLATHSLFHGYPEFNSHITLSYSAKDYPIYELPKFPFDYLKVKSENVESLDDSWT